MHDRTDAGVLTYLPENLNLSDVVPPKWHDYAAWFVGGLYIRRHAEKYTDPDAPRRVSSAALKDVLPKRDYKAILDALVAGVVVERTKGYRAGTRRSPGQCRGFWLAEAFRGARFRRVRLTHHELVRKVAKLRQREADQVVPELYRHLRNGLARLDVAPDAPNVLPLVRVRDRDFSFTVCRYGRVHTNLTNLEGALRPYLRVGGRPLWGTDIVNSQPLLLGLTLAGETGPFARDLAAYREELTEHHRSKQRNQPTQPMKEHAVPYVGTYSDGDQSDLGEYVQLCLSGSIYETLMAPTGFDRSTAKKEFFKVAYGRTRDGWNTPIGKAFRGRFPTCWEAMCRLKAGDYAELARRMQVVESYVVIWRACTRLMTEYPAAPLLTLHDSLVTDEAHIGAFERVLMDEFWNVFGVEPRVQTKPFAPPNAPHVGPARSDYTSASSLPVLAW